MDMNTRKVISGLVQGLTAVQFGTEEDWSYEEACQVVGVYFGDLQALLDNPLSVPADCLQLRPTGDAGELRLEDTLRWLSALKREGILWAMETSPGEVFGHCMSDAQVSSLEQCLLRAGDVCLRHGVSLPKLAQAIQ